MQPETEGKEEKGPNRIPYVNDPDKRPHPEDGRKPLEQTDTAEPEEQVRGR